jgi:hypothetical protein
MFGTSNKPIHEGIKNCTDDDDWKMSRERLKGQLAKSSQERLKREDNLKMELRKISGEGMNWVQFWVQWRTL